MKCYLSHLLGLALVFINIVCASASNADKEDKYYLIYVKNDAPGEYQVYSDSKYQKREESQLFIESLVDEIDALINDNKDTYKDQEKLVEIEENSQLRRKKRSLDAEEVETYDKSNFIYPISSVKDTVVLYAYLSDKLSQQIPKKFKNVIDLAPDGIAAKAIHKNYNVNEILSETGWSNLGVRENADFHLSLLSQGKYNTNSGESYDNNYYFPATNGKGIDIIVLDTSFHFKYSEFSNTSDRTVKCGGNVSNGRVSTSNLNNYCGDSTIHHGEVVSVSAAGLTHGSASRANVIGVSIPSTSEGSMNGSDILAGLQFIYEYLLRPNKSVINLSLGGTHNTSDSYYKQFKNIIDNITSRGGIVVAAAGNDGKNLDSNSRYVKAVPCEFENVICVGGTNNIKTGNKRKDSYYELSFFSNYGKSVDVYAPSYVKVNIFINNRVTTVTEAGTSFSSPIVAGLIANILGEKPNTRYNKATVLRELRNLSYETFRLTSGNIGYLANNGKHSVYADSVNAKDINITNCLGEYFQLRCCSHCRVSRVAENAIKLGEENGQVCGIRFSCDA